MASDNKDSSQPPIGGITVLLLLAAGIFVGHQRPFESARPGEGNIKLEQTRELQDIDARLWEDPYAAVSRWQSESGVSAAADQEHNVLPGLDGKTSIVGVMVYGGPYADDVEIRRRTRYAVLAGLDASGYVPERGDKIGFFRTKSLILDSQVPDIVPFEYFEGATDKILLLWLAEERFTTAPIEGLVGLLAKLGAKSKQNPRDAKNPDKKTPPDVNIIGPANSTTLKYMIAEAMSKCEDKDIKDGGKYTGDTGKWGPDTNGLRIAFYSPGATAIAGDLLPDKPKCVAALKSAASVRGSDPSRSLENVLWDLFSKGKEKNVWMLRTINNDNEVATALVEELALRGIAPASSKRDKVVLVSEWDTDYGRNLGERFITAVCERDKAKDAATEAQPGTKSSRKACPSNPEWLVTASYLRGLDGGVPSTAKRPEKGSQGKDNDEKGKNKEAPRAAEFKERADGNSQYDYLRRLARVVQERALGAGAKRVAAVGVLGSDLYDKLLVLQALRQQFPEAIFFTTDLDARLAQPDQYSWTRNLLVGSGFGLALNGGIQGSTPPFRDTYQTAAFLATRLALDPMDIDKKRAKLDQWLPAPRVYEIGRTEAFAFQPRKADTALSRPTDCVNLEQCVDIRPPLPFFGPASRLLFPMLLWSLSLALACWLLRIFIWPFRTFMDYLWYGVRKRRGAQALLAVVVVAVISVAAAAISDTQGEPFTFLEGISIWPTELIRVVAFVLMLYFIVRTLHPIELESGKPNGSFFPSDPAPGAAIEHGSYMIAKWYTLYREGGNVKVAKLWAEFRDLETLPMRFKRLIVPFVLYFGLIWCLFLALGEPVVPYRGWLAHAVDKGLIILCSLTFIVLLSLVCDVIRLGSALIRNLSTGRSDYPEETIKRLRAELNFSAAAPDAPLCDLLDIRLIGAYTEQANRVVYYPFIILALMVAARSSLIDNWTMPPSLAILFLLTLSIAVTCAVVLQRTAEHARDLAVGHMTGHLMRARGEPRWRRPYIKQLEMMLDEIKSSRRGAFIPFLQQPIVKAFLYPAGSFGGFQLLEYSLLGFAF